MLKSLIDVHLEEIDNLNEFNCVEQLEYYDKFSQYCIKSSGYNYLNYMLLHEKKYNFKYEAPLEKENKCYELVISKKILNLNYHCFEIAQNTDLIKQYQNVLSIDDKIYLTLLLINQRIRISYQQPNIETTINLFIKNLSQIKNEYTKLFKLEEKKLLNELTNTYFFPIVVKYINKELWNLLFSNNKWIVSKIIQQNDSYKFFLHDPKLLLNMFNLYEKESLINLFKNKKFSLFKTIGNKIEFCTGKSLPKQYKKTKARWDHGKNDYLEEIICQELKIIYEIVNKEKLIPNELEDWYEYIIKNNLIKIVQNTAYHLPINTNEINNIELKNLLKQENSDNIKWKDLLLNIKLEKELNNKNKTKKMKL